MQNLSIAVRLTTGTYRRPVIVFLTDRKDPLCLRNVRGARSVEQRIFF
jgi:hypothetical protein